MKYLNLIFVSLLLVACGPVDNSGMEPDSMENEDGFDAVEFLDENAVVTEDLVVDFNNDDVSEHVVIYEWGKYSDESLSELITNMETVEVFSLKDGEWSGQVFQTVPNTSYEDCGEGEEGEEVCKTVTGVDFYDFGVFDVGQDGYEEVFFRHDIKDADGEYFFYTLLTGDGVDGIYNLHDVLADKRGSLFDEPITADLIDVDIDNERVLEAIVERCEADDCLNFEIRLFLNENGQWDIEKTES